MSLDREDNRYCFNCLFKMKLENDVPCIDCHERSKWKWDKETELEDCHQIEEL